MLVYLPLQIPCLNAVERSQTAVEHEPLTAKIIYARSNLSDGNNV